MALKKLVQVGVQKNELGEIVAVFELKTLSDDQVKTLKEQAQLNQAKENAKRKQLENLVSTFEEELEKVKNELAYNRGELSREEYEELCNK